VSAREDHGRYRGRRRAPTPPRTRYAAVVTTALVGAGAVALGTVAVTPNMNAPGHTSLAALSGLSSNDLAARGAAGTAANRSANRAAPTIDQSAPDIWLLPLKQYRLSSPFGLRMGTMHTGVDLSAPEGTPYFAAHGGVVTLARYNGGYGYCVIVDLGNGIQMVYGHSSQLSVHEGQQVQAGDMLGRVGATGYSFGIQLQFEVRINGVPVNPLPYMLSHGVDIAKQTDPLSSTPLG
jgi:murein DD-endopeptidase MepM/ murein hydrolase activator NlpD